VAFFIGSPPAAFDPRIRGSVLFDPLGIAIGDQIQADLVLQIRLEACEEQGEPLHWTCLPGSSFPLLLVNQNRVVMSGFTKASKTCATGFRINIPVFMIGALVRVR
jgi:hypothetical protein